MTFNRESPFLITSRKFPVSDPLDNENVLTKSYTEVATAVNARTIGLYETVAMTTGNRYFSTGDPTDRRQSLRKVFALDEIAAGGSSTFAHEISNIVECTHIYGTCITDVPDFRPIPYVDASGGGDDIGIRVTSSQIIINNPGAITIQSGMIILEYLTS